VGAGSAIQIAAGTVAITDSIVASYTTGIAAGGTGALQGDYNLVYNAPTTLDIGPNSLTDDPRFRDPAAGNYRLLAASPAVGAGAPVSATTDIDGAPRPQGSGYDLGAHQVNLVWYVDPDGSDGNTCVFAGAANACKTITGALGKAQIGSTIYITTGVYTERLTVTVPIQFVGTGADAAAVVVDGGGAGRVFNVTASDATFSGLTIQNGADASGAGIRATGNLSMTNVAVLTNTATQDGGGIFAASALTLTNVEARANTASGNGGGIYASVAPSLTDVSLLSNQAQIGGGLYAPDASVLTGGLYRGNQATAAGGGIYAAGALTVTSASVLNNSATGSGGGVYAAGAVSVTSASLLNNTATGNGGGLYATGPVTVTATTVTGNAASENGGGLYAPAGAAVNGGIFQGNVAANAAAADEGGGGGLYTLAPATIVDTQFNGNRVSGQGGGGGAYISGTLTLTNVQFLNNTVALTSTTGGGGAYAVGDMMVAGGLFQGNACAGDGCQGGALFTSGVLTLTGARVVDNQAADAGGGVAATGDVVISDGVIQQNRSTSSTGGGAASMTGALTLTNTAVLSNTALGNGGGINALFGDATIDGGRIQGNACTDTACEGGGVYATNTLWLSGTQVIDNAADGTGGGANAWDTTVIDARFQGNQCIGAGCSCGGLAIFGTMAVTGTQFIANTADYYGGLCQSAATGGRVVNSLFARNAGRTDFDVAYFDSGEPVELLYTTVASPTIGANSAIVVSGTVNISNSIVASYTTGIAVAAGSLTSDYNLFYNAPTSAITGSNSLTGVNPLFFDMAADNYRLVSASPAIGAALDLGIDTDLDGTARPQLTSFDMGAFEYNPCGVANINDSGPGSLRDNLAACPEVVFDAGFFATPRTIQLSSPLTITTNVTVDGARYNIYTPTIQAPLAGGRVFTVAAGIDVTLNRLALTGGRLSGASEATGAGAGIFNAGALTVTNSIVSDNVAAHDTAGRGAGVYNADGGVLILAATTLFSNTAAEGGGLYVSGGAVTLDNALISTNLVTYTTSQRGGGVFVADGVLTVTNGSVITNNLAYTATLGDASYGGGINAAQVGALRLISGTIANNTANRGGGLYIDGAGALDLASVTVAGNRASLDVNSEPGNGIGGGIYATGALSLTGGVLRENVARISGGGLYASDWLTVTAVQFISNTAQSTESPSNHGGGGAYAVMTATVTGALFQGNAAGYVGGGLRAQQAATIAESNFFSNTAVNETGAAHIIGAAVITGTTFSGNRAAGYGALQVSDDAEIVNSLFRYNAATNAGGEAGGARIFGTALLTNVQFISNTAAYGGALLLNGGQAGWLTNTRFLSNTAGARGGAVQVDGPLTIDASHFEANQAWGDQGQGGAVYVGSTTVVTVTASNFLSNTATEFGGALADADGGGSDWVMRNSRFQGNTGGYAGAVAIGEDGSAEIADSDFVGNRTTNAGNGNAGAVYVFGPTVVVDSLFSGNAALKTGGALHVRGSTQITGTTFSANRAESFGAVYVQSATSPATIVDSTFVTNTSVNNGGAIYLDGPSYITATTFISNTAGGSGGAVGGVNVAIDASLFQSNTVAENGGAISVATARITDTIFVGNQALDGNGGALRTDGSAYVSGGRFERNRASLAGAVLTSDASVFTSVDFISNTATQSAGALRGSVDLEVIGSAFVSNTAGESAGAIYVGERGDIQASTFTGNRADASGGAIYVRGVTTITVSAFQSNTATLTGGAIEIDISGRAIISDTAIAYNRAGRNGGGVQAYGSVTFDGGSLHDNLCSPFCLIINGLYSQQIVTFTANTPYTYTDNLNLLGDVAVVGNYTFTAGIATFSPAPLCLRGDHPHLDRHGHHCLP
jgi:predicted outer membrane repeat protein